jgi:hypothetical protein
LVSLAGVCALFFVSAGCCAERGVSSFFGVAAVPDGACVCDLVSPLRLSSAWAGFCSCCAGCAAGAWAAGLSFGSCVACANALACNVKNAALQSSGVIPQNVLCFIVIDLRISWFPHRYADIFQRLTSFNFQRLTSFNVS